ncbi:hypothetical protein CBR_g606 [Chara braunii]|uniref:Uncharacterized protein n=1 Tax=Chara braunii TaxID=69332 RepID=A0A388KBN0_CHABU|nr:hypothetical protein CBR_g606 [Chara braunii]|eukprot:GBG67472.1 hypothetical protein CBR_g606 [Chara braunii]
MMMSLAFAVGGGGDWSTVVPRSSIDVYGDDAGEVLVRALEGMSVVDKGMTSNLVFDSELSNLRILDRLNEAAGWRGRRRSRGTILAFHPYKVGGQEVLDGELGGVERGSVEVVIGGGLSGVIMEKEGAGGSGRGLVMGVEESIVVKHVREEVSKGHVGFVGEGGGKIFVAYSLDVGDERKVGNDGGGEVMAEGANVLDEAVCGTGLAEVAELFEVVVNGFLGAEGGSEKFGPLEEGVTWSFRGSAVADFSHPPFGGIVEEAGGSNEEPVGKGHVVVEVVGVEEVDGGVLLEAAVEEGVVCTLEVGVVCVVEEGVVCAVVTTVMEGMVPSIVVMRSHMDDMLAFMSPREAVTEVRRVLSASRMAERSKVAVFVGGCSPARLRAMLSTESVRMSDMLMEDAAMLGEEGVEDVA